MPTTRDRATREVFAAKLEPLVQRSAEVLRVDIAERLHRAGGVKLVLVRAPAGFGKTTAMLQLREALEARGTATAWLTLDRADNDVPRFLAGLGAAVQHFGLERRDDVSGGVMELLAAETSPFALFLDDFELIREGGVVGLVRDIVEHLPRNGRLVVGSRSLPDLGLGRLRARGQLLELDTDILRFSTDEAAEFFRLRGAELPVEALDQALGKTEGWAAALWLLSLAIQRHGPGSHFVSRLSMSERDVADYLTEEVLAQQEPSVRNFLLRTSVLRHLSAPVCQALLPNLDCAVILQQLEHANVFLTPVAQTSGLYRYHSLFADFLRAHLEKEQPEQPARLHLVASGWYEAQGRPVPAIDHAIEGGDHPHALHLLALHAEKLLEQGRMRLLDRWFAAIPAAQLARQPRLQVIVVWAQCFTQGPWKAMQWLQASGCMDSNDAAVQAHVRALLPVLLAIMDRYDEAHRAGLAGVARLPTGNAFTDSVLLNAMAHIVSVTGERREVHRFLHDARQSQGDSAFNRMYTETVEGALDLREGRLRQATARFRMAITASSQAPLNYTHGNAWAGVYYAEAVYEANDLAAAERLLNVYLPLASDVGLPDHMISSHRMRSRIAFQRGDVDRALRTLTELEYLGHQRQLPRVVACAKLERARILVLQGNEPAARDELARANDPAAWQIPDQQQRPAQDVEDMTIGTLRVELRFGDAAPSVPLIQTELRRALSAERRRRGLKMRVLLGLAFYRSGDIGKSLDEMTVALREASQEGFIRLVLDEGPGLAPIVRRVFTATQAESAGADPIFAAYLQRLTELFGPGSAEEDAPAPGNSDALAEPLTRKELRVLQLLAEGYSNTAMAEKLFVSDSTVRTHLRNINTKLNSHSRTQALAAARRLGVIR
jgi:LuxR family transcriptional regulator, maltose regulon positive regulatory protein